MKSYETEEERLGYTERLVKRIGVIIARETPEGIGRDEEVWARVGESAAALTGALKRFEDGVIPKDKLDQAAALHLAAWRTEAKRFTREARNGAGASN